MGFNKGVSVLECHRDLYMHIKARGRQDGEDCLAQAGRTQVCTRKTISTRLGHTHP